MSKDECLAKVSANLLEMSRLSVIIISPSLRCWTLAEEPFPLIHRIMFQTLVMEVLKFILETYVCKSPVFVVLWFCELSLGRSLAYLRSAVWDVS